MFVKSVSFAPLVISIFCFAGLHSLSSIDCTFSKDNGQLYEQLQQVLTDPFYVERVTYTSDIIFYKSEFHYLTEIQEGELVCARDLARAVYFLQKKNIFQSIRITTKPGVWGTLLHFDCKGGLVFSRLKLSGFLGAFDWYRRYYIFNAGERFEQEKHQESVERIIDALHREGYFNCSVSDHIEVDDSTKLITVYITLSTGSCFRCSNISIQFTCSNRNEEEYSALKGELYSTFFKKMCHKKYNKKRINTQVKALREFLVKKGFGDISVYLREVVDRNEGLVSLHFCIRCAKEKELVFLGNNFISSDELCKKSLPAGSTLGVLPPQIIQEDILELYRSYGFCDATVQVQNERERCFFIINEGRRIIPAQIQLKGVTFFDAEMLRKKYLISAVYGAVYTECAVRAACDTIIDAYNVAGFLRARIVKIDYEPASESKCDVVISLDEGERSFIHSITVDGYEDGEEIESMLHVKNGDVQPFIGSCLQEQRDALMAYFKKKGFQQYTVSPNVVYKGAAVYISWHINKHENGVNFGKTIVQGNTDIPYEYLVRECAYCQGDEWSGSAIKKTISNLKKLSLFEQVQIFPDTIQSDVGRRPLLLSVHRNDPFELRVRCGLAVQQVSKIFTAGGVTYRFGGEFIIKNPFNYVDTLLFSSDVTRSQRILFVQYERPWLWHMPIKTIWKGYANRYQHPSILDQVKNLYEVWQSGFLVGLTYQGRYGESHCNIGIEAVRTGAHFDTCRSPCSVCSLACAIDFAPSLLDRHMTYIVCEPTCILDFVDNRLQPRFGFLTLFSCKGMFPASRQIKDYFYIRFMVEQSLFFPIKSVVCAVRLRGGHIFHEQFCTISPIDRFYLGGANSIRAWETDTCPPLSQFCGADGTIQYVPRGSKSLLGCNVEIRFPIYNKCGGVLFTDMGMLSNTRFISSIDTTFVAGSGFGLRYDTPIGPVRFDIAWKWRKAYKAEAPYAWFLTFGHAF